MGYVLRGVIGSGQVLRPSREFSHAVMVPLARGLSLIPMTAELFDEVRSAGQGDPNFRGCWFLPAGFAVTLAAWSTAGPVAYVEADYFGGTGTQAAVVWDSGELAPGLASTAAVTGDFRPGQSPISRALRHLGVAAAGVADEFDTVGLGRYRRPEDWLQSDR